MTDWLPQFQNALDGFARPWDDWAPTPEAITAAHNVLLELSAYPLKPSRIAPSYSSIVISFLRDNMRANIECFYDGSLAGCIAIVGQRVDVWDVKDLHESIRKIKDSLNLHELMNQLLSIQWSSGDGTFGFCPICSNAKSVGHKDNCFFVKVNE
jgi:hypothetical protein